jgi:hypothetical protein
MSEKNHRKVPKAFISSVETKTPKIGVFLTDRCQPDFRAEQMDREGPWGWDHFDSMQIQEVFKRFSNLKNSLGKICAIMVPISLIEKTFVPMPNNA